MEEKSLFMEEDNHRIYGYARVSTEEQHLDRQIEALLPYVKDERNIIKDKKSGKDFKRDGFLTLKHNMLRSGDTLVIKEFDRLGRNYDQIKEEYNDLVNMGVKLLILDTPMLSTNNKNDLECRLITSIALELFSYLAEKERHKIRSRVIEGIQEARRKGVTLGRPRTPMPDNFPAVCEEWLSGSITAVEAMRKTGLAKSTFYRMVNTYCDEQEKKKPDRHFTKS